MPSNNDGSGSRTPRAHHVQQPPKLSIYVDPMLENISRSSRDQRSTQLINIHNQFTSLNQSSNRAKIRKGLCNQHDHAQETKDQSSIQIDQPSREICMNANDPCSASVLSTTASRQGGQPSANFRPPLATKDANRKVTISPQAYFTTSKFKCRTSNEPQLYRETYPISSPSMRTEAKRMPPLVEEPAPLDIQKKLSDSEHPTSPPLKHVQGLRVEYKRQELARRSGQISKHNVYEDGSLSGNIQTTQSVMTNNTTLQKPSDQAIEEIKGCTSPEVEDPYEMIELNQALDDWNVWQDVRLTPRTLHGSIEVDMVPTPLDLERIQTVKESSKPKKDAEVVIEENALKSVYGKDESYSSTESITSADLEAFDSLEAPRKGAKVHKDATKKRWYKPWRR